MIGLRQWIRKDPGPRTLVTGLGALFAVLVVSGAIAEIGEDGHAEPASNSRNDAMARVMCEDFVRDQLVSPSSADFSSPIVRNTGFNDVYWVKGEVDAENRLGASIRAEYVCEVLDVGDGSWKLEDLQLNER